MPDPPGLGAIPVEVGLHKGIWIEGKLTDKETGTPVAGAWLHYLPFLENKFAQATPEFHGGGYTAGVGYQDRYQSKADGTYRLVGLPGRAIVGAVVYTGKPYRRGAGSESIKGMNEHGHFATYSNPVTASRHFPDLDEGDQSGRGHGDGPSRPHARSGGEGPPPGGRPAGKARDRGEDRRPPRPRPVR